MSYDDRQGIFMLRADMDEVDVEPVDLGDEIGQRVQSGLARAPVIGACPIMGEGLASSELDALRPIVDRLAFRPSGGVDTALEVRKFLVGRMILKRPD